MQKTANRPKGRFEQYGRLNVPEWPFWPFWPGPALPGKQSQGSWGPLGPWLTWLAEGPREALETRKQLFSRFSGHSGQKRASPRDGSLGGPESRKSDCNCGKQLFLEKQLFSPFPVQVPGIRGCQENSTF